MLQRGYIVAHRGVLMQRATVAQGRVGSDASSPQQPDDQLYPVNFTAHSVRDAARAAREPNAPLAHRVCYKLQSRTQTVVNVARFSDADLAQHQQELTRRGFLVVFRPPLGTLALDEVREMIVTAE